MPLRSFHVHYRFEGARKTAPLPEWLADSVDDRFGGDLGLTQTTRVSAHQTKLRLLAAAIDAVEAELGHGLNPGEVDAALVERGLSSCVERHRAAWEQLAEGPVPTFEHAFELRAPSGHEPAFLQCPEPGGEPVEVTDGLRLLPDLGFSVPARVPAADEAGLAFQLMGYAGRLWYYRGKPTSSRPLGQAVAVDVPGRPAWRVRHELRVLLEGIKQGRERLRLRGGVVFAWLLPFLPEDKPIPRAEQHPLLLDVPSPVRVRADGRVAIYNRPCVVGGSEMALPTAALAHKSWWAASGLPCVAIEKPKKGGQAAGADDLRAAGLDPAPDLVQRPYGKVPDSGRLLELIRSTPMGGGGSNEGLHPPVLTGYADGPEPIGEQAGAELVVEGEPIGNSTTAFWLDVRVPLPEPDSGAESGQARWRGWQGAVARQLETRSKAAARLAAAAEAAWLGRRRTGAGKPSSSTKAKARGFARRWTAEMEAETDPALWAIAARTWADKASNEARWQDALDRSVRRVAMRAFEALGGFDDSAALLASAGLLALAEGRRGKSG